MKCRLYKPEDIDQVREIIKSHTKMHGKNIEHLQEKYVDAFTMQDNIHGAFCLVDDNDVVQGIMRTTMSESLPIWSIDFAFFIGSESINHMGIWREWTSMMFDAGIEYAEARNRYEFYYAVRDHNNVRLNKLLEINFNLRERYEICDVEVLYPGEKSKYGTFNILQRILDAKAQKITVIRHCHLKKQYRANPWLR